MIHKLHGALLVGIAKLDKKDDGSTMPDIQPDFTFPGSTGFQTVISWVLGAAMLFLFLALIILAISLATKGFGNQQMQQFSAKAIGLVFIGLVVVGSTMAIFNAIIGIDWGF